MPALRISELTNRVAVAEEKTGEILASRSAQPDISIDLDGAVLVGFFAEWAQTPISLPVKFLKDFPKFQQLEKLSQKVGNFAEDIRAKGASAINETAFENLRDYRRLLEELADTIGSSATLVVSGGVSLGSYQAGFLHYQTQFLLAHHRAVTETYGLGELVDGRGVTVATGASAGSINAFLSTLTSCRPPVSDPRESLFWSAWIPVGFHNLIDRTKVTFNSALSQLPLDNAISRVGTLWQEPQELSNWEDCNATFGISATRLKSREIDFSPATAKSNRSDALRLKRQTEKFVLKLSGKSGQAPTFSPFRPYEPFGGGDGSPVDVVYPTLGESKLSVLDLESLSNSFDEVATLLKASAAFPLAFAPVPLKMTTWKHKEDGHEPLEHGTVPFVDGGVLDNTPIGLAVKIRAWLRSKKKPVPSQLVFLSSDSVGWTRPGRSGPSTATANSLVETYSPFLSDFISTAEGTELLNTLESFPSAGRDVPLRMMPIAGEQLQHFFGFAEEDFRIFDFFVGMVDAREYLASQHPGAVGVLSRTRGGYGPVVNVDSPEFACFDEHRRRLRLGSLLDVDRIDACKKVDSNIVALLKASSDLRENAQVSSGSRPDIDAFVAKLEEHGYRYKQLKYRGEPATKDTATLVLRESTQMLIQELGSKQPFLEQYPVSMIGKALANSFEYLAPRLLWNVGVLATSGVEGGLTRLFSPYQRVSWGPMANLRIWPWERTPVAQNQTVNTYVAARYGLNLGLRLEYAHGPGLQLDLVPSFELEYLSHRRPWAPYYLSLGWSLHGEVVLYQRFYLLLGVYGLPRDTRSDADLMLENRHREWCCEYRLGLGVRFFSI